MYINNTFNNIYVILFLKKFSKVERDDTYTFVHFSHLRRFSRKTTYTFEYFSRQIKFIHLELITHS